MTREQLQLEDIGMFHEGMKCSYDTNGAIRAWASAGAGARARADILGYDITF